MSYFATECGGYYRDHITIVDENGNVVFNNYLNMTYDDMKSQEDLGDFVFAVMDAAIMSAEEPNDNCQTIITLIDDDGIFIWSIIIGIVDDEIRYSLVDWRKDGMQYRYES